METYIASMGTDQEVEHFAICCGLAAQSLEQIRSEFPRWRRRLKTEGVPRIPWSPWSTDPQDRHAVNLLTQMILQASAEPSAATMAHHVRNLTGFRPPKL